MDGAREMIGIGAANLAAGFFQGFPVSTSGSRTAVAEQAGAKTQVTGLVGAAAITLSCWSPSRGCWRDLPQPTLAAVVITASLSLADFAATRRLLRVRRTEFLLSMAAFLGVVLLGVLPGIAIAVALSIGNVFRRAWWPYQTTLGRVSGLPGYHDVRSSPTRSTFRPASSSGSTPRCSSPTGASSASRSSRSPRSEPAPSWIIVAAEPMTDVDTTAADILEDLVEDLAARGISLVFAEMKDPVRRDIERYELARNHQPRALLPDDHPGRQGVPDTDGSRVGAPERRTLVRPVGARLSLPPRWAEVPRGRRAHPRSRHRWWWRA